MNDPSQLSDEELLRLLGAAEGGGPQVDQASVPLSDRELAAQTARVDDSNPVLAGTKHVVDKVISGGAQSYIGTRKLFAPKDKSLDTASNDLAADEGKKDTYYKAFSKENPLGTAVGEALPTLPLSSGGMVAAGLKSAVPGLISYGNTDERMVKGAEGGVGGILGNVISRLTGGYVNPNLSAAQRRTIADGREMGIMPRLSQVTNSPGLEGIEDWASQVPGGRSVMEGHAMRNTTAMNRGAANSMGEAPDSAGRVGESVFQSARNRLGGVFREITNLDNASGTPTIQLSSGQSAPPGGARIMPHGQPAPGLQPSPLTTAADEVLRRQGILLPQAQNNQVMQLAQMVRDASMQNGAAMTGEQYQAARSFLTKAQHEAFSGGDPEGGRAFENLLSALDDVADTSLRRAGRVDLADALQTARPQYGNMKMLERGRVSQGGNVSADRVAQAQRTQNPSAFRTGAIDGPLGTIGRWAEQFPPLRSGSQTASRIATGEAISTVRNPARLLDTPEIAASIPIARATTSPLATWLPGRIGGTAVGRVAETVLPPAANAGVQSYFRRLFTRPQTP